MLIEYDAIYLITRILWLILAVLAVYRLSHMIVSEDGPLGLNGKIRGVIYDRAPQGGHLQRGFACVLCVSFWLSWLIVLLLPWAGWSAYVLESLGIAGACLLIHRRLYGDNG